MTIDRDRLIGAWTLVSAIEVYADGARRPEFGPDAAGFLSYSPNGIVTAVLGSTTRSGNDATEPQTATDNELAGMARQFIAYAGPFTIVDNTDTVIHHLEVSLFTGWQGDEQPRTVHIDGDTLRIVASPRTAPDGRRFHSELTWTRA